MPPFFESEGYEEAMDNWVGRYVRSGSLEPLLRLTVPGDRLLDMGCGTGTEAAALTNEGRLVYGFDPSPAMVAKAKETAPHAHIVQGSFGDLPNLAIDNGWPRFDLVYSSLGALNCVEDLKGPLTAAFSLLQSGGYMVVSSMNRYPALEIAGTFLSLRFSRAIERTKKIQQVNVNGSQFQAYYHTLDDFRRALPDKARIVGIRALPFSLPPIRAAKSIDPAFHEFLIKTDRLLSPHWPFNRLGDHLQLEIIKD